MAIVVYTSEMAHVFEPKQTPPLPRARRGTKAQRARKVYRSRRKGPSFPHKRYPGRKCISRGLGRNIR